MVSFDRSTTIMKYYEKSNFDPGGLLDRYDSRDYKFEEVAGAAPLPFNWNTGFDIEQKLSFVLNIPNFKLKVKDQGASYSCGGQSWSYLAEVLEALNTGTYEPRSAKYLYAQTCIPEGGSRGRDNADVYVNQGIARENVLTSYQASLPPSEPFMQRSIDITDPIRVNAKLAQASAYAQVATDIESIAVAIRENSGVVLGIEGSNNGTWVSEFPKAPTTIAWRHWIYAGKAKLINGKKFIGVLNSWGKDVGNPLNPGWQWLDGDYFPDHVFSGWTHVFAPVLPPMFTHKFLTNISYGQMSPEVVALQTALKIEKFYPVTVPISGFYGDITTRAVLAFQLKYKIITRAIESNYGRICGPITRQVLNSFYGN